MYVGILRYNQQIDRFGGFSSAKVSWGKILLISRLYVVWQSDSLALSKPGGHGPKYCLFGEVLVVIVFGSQETSVSLFHFFSIMLGLQSSFC